MLQDLRFALRTFGRRRGLLLLAVTTLALGVGASTALFSLVNGVLLRPLPYRDPERLAILWHVFGQGAQDLPAMHPLDYRDYRDRSRTLEALTIATPQAPPSRLHHGASPISASPPKPPDTARIARITTTTSTSINVKPPRRRNCISNTLPFEESTTIITQHPFRTGSRR